jgi:ribosome-associated protein
MTEHLEDDQEWISKTRRKRECDALQELGEQLVSLKNEELEKFDLPGELLDAVLAAKKIRQRGALKRQKQFIGRLMRDVDADQIAQRLETIRHKDDINNAHFKRIEKWRDTIIADGDSAISDFMEEYPQADRQHLRQLYRNAINEQKKNKPPVSFRQLFKYIRELSETQI